MDELTKKQEDDLLEESRDRYYGDFMPVMCPHCGLDLDLHDGDGFCPGGTEEFGGRR